ncbi:hypothetical protein HYALB_00006610 [Hymenoscyphus albidus]|uniref:Clr5 domain-containing protein n=1 Tax=Hymenoscyphus albidus TaxID=595503 RepID=A0A9N9LLQ8_9HELO|nr:hypothetical protein HYALB_00006610 [Hymenoscyphus albidus]
MAFQGTPPFFQDVPYTRRWGCLKPTIRCLYIDEDLKPNQLARKMKDDFRFDALEHQYKYKLKKWGMTKNMPSKKKESAILAIRKRTKDPNSSMSIKYNGETIDKRKIRRHISDVEKAKKKQEHTLQLKINLILTTWLYQFWLFSFETAKHWGHGPLEWNAEILDFDRYKDTQISSTTDTPMLNIGTPYPATPGAIISSDQHESLPPKLCKWTMHAFIPFLYGREYESSSEAEEMISIGGVNWPRWTGPLLSQNLDEKLQRALETNTFSNIRIEDLPVAMAQIARITKRSKTQIVLEAFSFSIIARNEEVFWKLLDRVTSVDFAVLGLYPHHLTTTYLDGSNTCRNLLDATVNNIRFSGRLYINDYRHKVLDNLFITILKGHTSCPPVTVDDAFQKLRRFPGEEIDICGRWDADSECIRELFAGGKASIPFEWKHMFCHTSAQAVVHCIGRIFGPAAAPDINTPSGLFARRCQCCDKQLKLLPLHSLVLVAFHLARSGCAGEKLFGMLTCLVCLLAYGCNPLLRADTSLKALMADECSHEQLDALELAERVPEHLMTGWADEAKLGWQVLCAVLSFAREERRSRPEHTDGDRQEYNRTRDRYVEYSDDGMDLDESSDVDEGSGEDGPDYYEPCQHYKLKHNNFYGRSRTIGTLWAAIQTELLSYRRLEEGDGWMSEKFNMLSLLHGLKNGGIIPVTLVEDGMMAPYCECGRFLDVIDEACVCVAEACAHYFCNMEDWERSANIGLPVDSTGMWYDF